MRCAKNILNYFDYKPPIEYVLEEKKHILKPPKVIIEEEEKSVPLIKTKSAPPMDFVECDSVVVSFVYNIGE